MQLHKLAVFGAALVICTLGGPPAWTDPQLASRVPRTPLLIGIRRGQRSTGDIWAWGGTELIQRTDSGLGYVPIVSPLGDSFVYLRIPAAYAKQSAANEDRPAPWDIYLMNLVTAQTTVIARQPSAASFAEGQAHYTLRSEPTWSPDGKLLAWTELTVVPATDLNLQAESLVLYDVAAKTAHTLIPKLPPHRVVGQYPALSEVALGPDGLIAVRVHIKQDIDSSGQDWLYFYDGTGKQIARLEKLEAVEANYEYSQLIWLSGLKQAYLSCIACTTKINPVTGTADALNGTPEMYSALAPDKLSLYFRADSGDESNVTWIIALNGKQVSKFASVRIANLRDAAIAPDGLQAASASYSGQGTAAGVFIYQAQSQRAVKVTVNVIGLGWGPMAWRVHVNAGQ